MQTPYPKNLANPETPNSQCLLQPISSPILEYMPQPQNPALSLPILPRYYHCELLFFCTFPPSPPDRLLPGACCWPCCC